MTQAGPGDNGPVEPRASAVDIAGGSGRSLLRRIVIYLPGSVVPAALALVTSMVFTRVFTAAEFGMFSLAAIVVATPLKVVSTTWLVQSVGKFLPAGGARVGTAARAGRRDPGDGADTSRSSSPSGRSASSWVAFCSPRSGAPSCCRHCCSLVVTSLFEVTTTVFAAEARAIGYTASKLADSVLTLTLRLVLVSGLVSMDVTLMLWSVVHQQRRPGAADVVADRAGLTPPRGGPFARLA